ncbi:MAG: hypothetical protein JWR74_1243 [Polaromonas sp.]|jgi:hypothetical protein|nr:hypothetical protein [Polaromonas sp.]
MLALHRVRQGFVCKGPHDPGEPDSLVVLGEFGLIIPKA